MQVSGIGSITTIGLRIFSYCRLNDVALTFRNFVVSDYAITLANLSDPSYLGAYGALTKNALLDLVGASNKYFVGNVNVADKESTLTNSTQLPLLMSIVSNSINEEISFKTAFILARDENGTKLTVADTSALSLYDTIYDDTTGASGRIQSIDSARGDIYLALIVPSATPTLDFIAGHDVYESTAVATKIAITTQEDAEYVVQQTSLVVDERLTVKVVDASTFSVSGSISSEDGASGTVTAIVGDTLTVNRSNIIPFVKGDKLDNTAVYSAQATTIYDTVIVDVATSVVMPVVYISEGSDLLLRVIIRDSSGFPANMNFINTAINEIEEHNADGSDTHLDMRQMILINMSKQGRDIRRNKDRIDALVLLNGLTE